MKKFTKGCLITAVILIVLGSVISIAFLVGGGQRKIKEMVWNGDFSINYKNNIFPLIIERHNNTGSDYEYGDWDWELDNHTVYTGSHRNDKAAKDVDISNLDLRIGGCYLEIRESEDEYFKIESKDFERFTYYVEGDTFVVIGLRETVVNNITDKMYLYIPKGMMFDTVSAELGACHVVIDTLDADHILFEMGAGKLEVAGLNAEFIDIGLGAGDITFKETYVTNMNADIGIGSFTMQGNVKNDLTASCAMGSMELQLSGRESDHNYDIECAMGSVQTGSRYNSGFVTSRYTDNGADSNFTLNCSMGSIVINFK